MKAQYDAMYTQKGEEGAAQPQPEPEPRESSASQMAAPLPEEEPGSGKKKKGGGLLGGLFRPSSAKAAATEEMYELTVMLERQQDGLGIGLTLDNIIVEVEPGDSVH